MRVREAKPRAASWDSTNTSENSLVLALARAKLAARGFGLPTIEQRALSQISRRTDCAGAAQPCERRTHYKEYPNQLKRQIGVGNKAPQITVHNF